MSAPSVLLHGFAYGEHLEGVPPRSLGFGLLAPAAAEPWAAEVEAVARRLHATHYPDPWPVTDLFCSLLLADGRRLVALARYGLADHTPSRRRGGLELVGVVAPGPLGVTSALAVYRWLRQRRAQADDLRTFGGQFDLGEVMRDAPPAAPPQPTPVVPIRLWQDGALVFAAVSPLDPDQRLGLLDEQAGSAWQWLPLCGPDFPLQEYARRGPLVAWTAHLADFALKLNSGPAVVSGTAPPVGSMRRWGVALAVVLLLLLVANLWVMWTLPGRLAAERPASEPAANRDTSRGGSPVKTPPGGDSDREKFAQALYKLLTKEARDADGAPVPEEAQLHQEYQRAAQGDKDLAVSSAKGQAAVGLAAVLARHSPEALAKAIQEEVGDSEFARLLSSRLRARLLKR
jgi:hypothetical protein